MTDKTVLNQKQAAELRGVTPRCLRQLETEGDNPPPRNANGKYPALEYGDWLKNQYTNSRFAYAKEKARLTHYQANEKELQVKAFKRELLPYDEVVDHWTMLLRNARAVILTIPAGLLTNRRLLIGLASKKKPGALSTARLKSLRAVTVPPSQSVNPVTQCPDNNPVYPIWGMNISKRNGIRDGAGCLN